MKTELSFEVFPPKSSDGIEKIYNCLDVLSGLKPSFISVTYSAGNAKKGLTSDVCAHIEREYGIKAVSHLTCTGATKESINNELSVLKSRKVNSILALRGDITPEKQTGEYRHAVDLMKEINSFGGFEIMGACYPEGHAESGSVYADLSVLKLKYDLGVRTFISQLFLNNSDFLRMRDTGKAVCEKAEFRAGIMPVLTTGSVYRMITLSGARLSDEMREILNKYADDPVSMRKAGEDYAVGQIRDLVKEGCGNIHLYTMCKTDVTEYIYDGIKDLV